MAIISVLCHQCKNLKYLLMSEPLILTILRVPITLINLATCIVGSVFYAPSYIFFFLIHPIIFNESLSNTLGKYVVLWVPKLGALSLGFYLFVCQFYYAMKFYWEHDQDTGWKIKVLSLTVSTLGFLFLMRRGYLKSLKYLKIKQLKSPKEHVQALLALLKDIPSVFLGLVNLIMLSHSLETFKYEFHPQQRNFLPHISRLVAASIFYNFQKSSLLYLSIFPWRLRESKEIKTQKPYSLEKSVLIFFLLFNTNLDILVFITLGWIPFLSPWLSWKRYIAYIRREESANWKKGIFSFVLRTVMEYISLTLLTLSLPIQPLRSLKHFKQTSKLKKTLNGGDLSQNIVERESDYDIISCILFGLSLLSVLGFFAKIILLISVYKYKKLRRDIRVGEEERKREKEEEKGKKERFDALDLKDYNFMVALERNKIVYAFEFMIDLGFWVLAIVSAVMKPWEFRSLPRMIDDDYNLKRGRAAGKVIHGVVLSLVVIALIILFPLYFHRLETIIDWYRYPSESEVKLSKMKRLETLAFRIVKSTLTGLNYLPLWYSMLIFGAQPRISTNEALVQQYQSLTLQFQIFYRKSMIRLFNKDLFKLYELDKDNITSAVLRLKFWRAAHQIKNLKTFIKIAKIPIIVTYYLSSYFSRKAEQIEKEVGLLEISNVSKELEVRKRVLSLALKINLRIIVEFCLFLASLVLVALTLWRIPTLIYMVKTKKYQMFKNPGQPTSLALFKTILFVNKQQLGDLIISPLYILGFIFSPIRAIKYILKFSYRYTGFDSTPFLYLFYFKRRYFWHVIFIPSLNNVYYLTLLTFTHLTLFRVREFYQILSKQNLSLTTFFSHVIGTETLPPLDKYQDVRINRVLMIKKVIAYSALQALRDVMFIPFYIFPLLFPYRIMHVVHIWNLDEIPKDETYRKLFLSGRRKNTLNLVGRILRDDFICFILSATLTLSLLRTRRGIQLIRKNLRRNITIKFLIYDFKRDLIEEFKLLLKDIQAVFSLFIISIYMVSIQETLRRCRELHAQNKLKRKAEEELLKVREVTMRSKKEDKISLIGLESFKSICQYLDPMSIHHLSRASKDMYTWCNEDELWEEIWQERYEKSHPNVKVTDYKQMCIKEYLAQRPPMQEQLTYYDIIAEELKNSILTPVSFTEITGVRPHLQGFVQRTLDFDNLVPEGIEFLMNNTFYLTTVVIPVEFILKITPFFNRPNMRYLKQALVVVIGIAIHLVFLRVVFTLCMKIYEADKWIGVSALGLMYTVLFFHRFSIGFKRHTIHSQALYPFDGPQRLYSWIIPPIIRLLKYVGGKVKNTVKWVAEKLFEKVLSPLYKRVADALRGVKSFISLLFQGLRKVLQMSFRLIGNIFKGIKAAIIGLGRGYLGILIAIMNSLYFLGKLGDLIFTIIAVAYFFLPLILSYFFYWKSVAVIPSLILSIITVVKGYKRIQSNHERRSQ